MTFLPHRTAIAANGLLAADLPGWLEGELPALAECLSPSTSRDRSLRVMGRIRGWTRFGASTPPIATSACWPGTLRTPLQAKSSMRTVRQ